MNGTLNKLRILSLVACVVIVLPAFLCGCESKKDKAEAHYGKAEAYNMLWQYAEALAAYKKSITIKPDYAEAYLGMGLAYEGLEQHADSIAAYKQAISIKPDYAEAYCNMGNVYWRMDQTAEAIGAYKKCITIDPDDADAHYGLGLAYEKLEQYPEAIAAFKKFIAIEPTGLVASFVPRRIGELQKRIELERIFDKHRPETRAVFLNGQNLLKAGRFEEAIDVCKKAITLKPYFAHAYYIMGESYTKLEQYAASVTVYTRIGMLHGQLEQYADAITAFKKAIAINPDYADAYWGLGCVYYGLKQYPDALAAYKKYLAIEPTGEWADAVREQISKIRNMDKP